MGIIMGILFLYLLFVEPIAGHYVVKKLKETVDSDNQAKIRFYQHTIMSMLIPALIVVSLVVFTDIRWREIGIALPTFDTDVLGTWVSYGAIGIGILYLLILLVMVIGYYVSKRIKNAISKHRKEALNTSKEAALFPVTKKEKSWWAYVSVNAAVTEVILYQGFAVLVIAQLLPFSVWLGIVATGILFGLGYSYQGFIKGFVNNSLFGIFLVILYGVTGSILPCMVLHLLTNYWIKLGE